MIESNSQSESGPQTPLQSARSNRNLSRSVDLVGQSAKRAEAAIRMHPYFTAGIVAGLGLAIGGTLVVRARQQRRRWFADLLSRWI